MTDPDPHILRQIYATEPANLGSPGKWPLKQSVRVSGSTLEGRFKNGIKPGAREERLRLRMAGSHYSPRSIRRIASKRMRASTLRASRHRYSAHTTRPA